MRTRDGKPGWITLWRGIDKPLLAIRGNTAMNHNCGQEQASLYSATARRRRFELQEQYLAVREPRIHGGIITAAR